MGPDGRSFDHTRRVLDAGGSRGVTGLDVAVRHHRGATHREDRADAADGGERIPGSSATSPKARCVTPSGNPAKDVQGKHVLVYDDVFTDGLTLNEVARALRRAGADEVCGVTLCRQPYGGSRYRASFLMEPVRQFRPASTAAAACRIVALLPAGQGLRRPLTELAPRGRLCFSHLCQGVPSGKADMRTRLYAILGAAFWPVLFPDLVHVDFGDALAK